MFLNLIPLLIIGYEREPSEFWIAPNQCSAWAVYQGLLLQGIEPDWKKITARLPANGEYKSLLRVKEALTDFGVAVQAVRFPESRFVGPPKPAIIALSKPSGPEPNHFVTVVGWRDGKALAVDGPYGSRWIEPRELKERWTGEALLIGTGDLAGTESAPAIWRSFAASLFLAAALATLFGRRLFRKAPFPALLALFGMVALGCERSNISAPSVVQSGSLEVLPAKELEAIVPENVADPVRQRATGTANFTLVNRTGKSIEIKGFRETCGCSVVEGSARRLANGEQAAFKVILQGHPAQELLSTIFVATDHPEAREIAIRVRRSPTLDPPFVSGPQEHHFGVFNAPTAQPAQLSVNTGEALDSEPWIRAAMLDTHRISLRPNEVRSSKRMIHRQYSMEFALPQMSPGAHSSPIRLLDARGETVGTVRVTWEVSPPVRCAPSAIIAHLGPHETISRTIVLSRASGAHGDLSVELPPSLPDWLTIDKKIDGPTQAELKVTIAPFRLAPGKHAYTLALRTNVAGASTLSLPIALTRD